MATVPVSGYRPTLSGQHAPQCPGPQWQQGQQLGMPTAFLRPSLCAEKGGCRYARRAAVTPGPESHGASAS